MPPTKGGNASNQGIRSTDSITAPKAEARALFTKQQKKEGSHPLPVRRITPSSKGSNHKVPKEIPTGRRHYDQTTTGVSNPRKSRGPTLCSVRRIHLLRMMLFYVHSVTNPSAIGGTTH